MTTRDDMALRGPTADGPRLLAGRLSAELVSGGLRDIRYDGHEVLRAIDYVAVSYTHLTLPTICSV